MEYKILNNFEEFILLKDEWERIEKQSNSITYFSIFQYNYLWWKTNLKVGQKQLFVILIYNNNNIVGIAPLKIETVKKRLFSYNELNFITPSDYSDLLIDINSGVNSMKIIAEIFSVIEANKEKYDKIWLTHIAHNTLLVHFLLISKNNKNLIYLIENPYINFSKFNTFENYTYSFLPKKTKQYLNRLQREIKFKMIVTNENVIEEISKIHIAEKEYLQTKGNNLRHSLFEDENIYNFFNSLYSNNPNVLTYLLVDVENKDEIICFYTGYVFNNVFHSGITAYNPKYQKLAVGKIFNYMIFETNDKEQRWKIFDMGTGRYEWKFEMTDTFNLLYQYHVFQPSSKKKYYLDKIEKLISAFLQFIRK